MESSTTGTVGGDGKPEATGGPFDEINHELGGPSFTPFTILYKTHPDD